MAFKLTTKTTPDPDEIILFTGKNYTGETYSSVIGDNISVPLSLNDKFYSVKVGSAAKVVLIRDYNFSGPTLETDVDDPSISLGGPGSGLSCFIVLQKVGKYIARFSFVDQVSHNRSLKLISSNFNPTGEEPNPGVIILNLDPGPEEDPNAPRVFSLLDESNTINLPVTVGLYVRKTDGIYEDIGALILVYLADSQESANSKIINAKALPGYNYGNLTFNSQGDLINFIWE